MTMEIETCEQYVLMQLFEQQNENDRLCRELQRRDERIGELTRQAEAARSPLRQAIVSEGRKALYGSCAGYACSVERCGELLSFEDWCLEDVSKYILPAGVTLRGFVEEFEDELREEYRKQLAKEGR